MKSLFNLLLGASIFWIFLFISGDVIAQSIPDSQVCHSSQFKNTVFAMINSKLAPFLVDNRCETSTYCPGSLRAAETPARLANLDLMEEELGKMSNLPDEKIAVVDTGYLFWGEMQALDEIPPVRPSFFGSEKGSVRPNDQVGHGTMVSFVANGFKPLNAFESGVQVTPYQPIEFKYEGSAASSSGLYRSILESCREGHKIINFSAGHSRDESGAMPYEVEYKTLLDELNSQGCLLITSSGNDRRLNRERSHEDPYDNLLRVGGSGSIQREIGFATPGEVFAPADQILVPLAPGSKMKEQLSDTAHSCAYEGPYQNYAFIDGTSLSAPLISRIAAQVRRVLRTTQAFDSLSGPEQTKLMTGILSSAQTPTSVDALKAVRLAQGWAKTGHFHLEEAMLEVQCSLKPQCDSAKTCEESQFCLKTIRQKLSLCPSLSDAELRAGIEEATTLGDPALLLSLLRVMNDRGVEPEELRTFLPENMIGQLRAILGSDEFDQLERLHYQQGFLEVAGIGGLSLISDGDVPDLEEALRDEFMSYNQPGSSEQEIRQKLWVLRKYTQETGVDLKYTGTFFYDVIREIQKLDPNKRSVLYLETLDALNRSRIPISGEWVLVDEILNDPTLSGFMVFELAAENVLIKNYSSLDGKKHIDKILKRAVDRKHRIGSRLLHAAISEGTGSKETREFICKKAVLEQNAFQYFIGHELQKSESDKTCLKETLVRHRSPRGLNYDPPESAFKSKLRALIGKNVSGHDEGIIYDVSIADSFSVLLELSNVDSDSVERWDQAALLLAGGDPKMNSVLYFWVTENIDPTLLSSERYDAIRGVLNRVYDRIPVNQRESYHESWQR
jgi:hypothetical protein